MKVGQRDGKMLALKTGVHKPRMPTASRSWQRLEQIPFKAPEGVGLHPHLDFSLRTTGQYVLF